MAKECLWYNGEEGVYHLLDFDPNGLTKEQIKQKVIEILNHKGFDIEDCGRELETVYLVDIDDLKKII